MTPSRSLLFLYVALSVPGCGASDSADDFGPAVTTTGQYRACAPEETWGEFIVQVNPAAKSTNFQQGSVLNGVEGHRYRKEVLKAGLCRMVQPPQACDPECSVDKSCSPRGCVNKPALQDVGTVSISGLARPVTLENIGNNYSVNELPYPGYREGATVEVKATGAGGSDPFTITAYGVAPLRMPTSALPAESGKPTSLTWTPPANPGSSRVLIDFAVNLHGLVDTHLECEVPDTGSYTIDAAIMTELFKRGVSGFPRVSVKRQSAGTATVKGGCVQFALATKEIDRDLKVPGLISCHEDKECPSGKTCLSDLSCSK